ncbi:MAG: hypothetical protein H8D87_16655 [Deltaproteobacteria bacterium]|uniref:hypothetical protein n=1 Tax=Desulfobacula sp. TaxID=2593537 RepID=UPI0019A6FDEC|nr:hypothetical protein [Candidatus Desulfobacula maris]MBL6993819.1 hypothetical protein [Desulfobacula sp.]
MAKNIFLLFFSVFFIVACEKIPSKELVLFDFESESVFDEFHWKCRTLFSLSDDHAVQGKKSLKLELYPSSYPGLSPALKHHDWRGYQALFFEVYNPSPEMVSLVLRIDDKKDALEFSDRYNKSLKLLSGANKMKIPLDSLKTSGTERPLELKNIYRFMVFMSQPDKKYVLYLDYFRLVPLEDV